MSNEDCASVAAAAKKVRTALKQTFPGIKFSVTSRFDIHVMWTDDGPSLVEVKSALLSAGCAEAVKAWNGEEYLKAHGHSFWFDRYNVAERAAAEQERERRQREYEAQKQRGNEAISAAYAAKRAAQSKQKALSPKLDLEQERVAHDAFERLRQRAEADVVSDDERSRRPSWAPPLILGEELAEICLELGYLTLDDKWIARLWAQFASPTRVSKHLRETVSGLALPGIVCRGFQLHPAGERQATSRILFEAQRTESGKWRFGPTPSNHSYWSPHQGAWEQLIRKRATATEAADVERLSQQIATIDAEDQAAAQVHSKRHSLQRRAVELAKARVLDFAGAPDAQMQMAGRLWGHCCICGKALTDPISLERGIGPDCLKERIDAVRGVANEMRNAGTTVTAERVAAETWLPVEFVAGVLGDEQIGASP